MAAKEAGMLPLHDYHAIMSAAMIAARRARMRVDADLQILTNRIARLQREEVRAIRRIEMTHKRTQEIIAIKARAHQSELEGEKARAIEEAAREEHRKILAQAREEQRMAVAVSQQALLLARKEEALEFKKVATENSAAIARARGAEYLENAARRNMLRETELEARKRRAQERQMAALQKSGRAQERRQEEEARSLATIDRLRELKALEEALTASIEKANLEQAEILRSVEERLSMRVGKRELQINVEVASPPHASLPANASWSSLGAWPKPAGGADDVASQGSLRAASVPAAHGGGRGVVAALGER